MDSGSRTSGIPVAASAYLLGTAVGCKERAEPGGSAYNRCDVVRRHDLAARVTVLMGVVHGALAPRLLVEWILEDALPVRFQLQMHKVVWPPDARGV